MSKLDHPAALLAAISLFAGCLSLFGCQSNSRDGQNPPPAETMSGTGGGNGTFGSNPAQAMHSNPNGTPLPPATQPGQ